ncbi:hypothetical protein H4R34_003731 [Dimargaris verticillata]|uniref:FIST domain-containing protein n=1 Tax=Dimargaris verticillata TaxID=2761393 RepID=A0A9W8B5J2_9FUNG|nr:hypothetical protein H4R34_003731 [Dimargaris verticillata]
MHFLSKATSHCLRAPLTVLRASRQRAWRHYWTIAASTHEQLGAALDDCAAQLTNAASQNAKQARRPDCLMLWAAASLSTLGADLITVPELVRTRINPRHLVGCVVNQVVASPVTCFQGSASAPTPQLAMLAWTAPPGSDAGVVPFVIDETTTARHKLKTNAVGRWQPLDAYQVRQQNPPDSANRTPGDWSQFRSVSEATNPVVLPDTLQALAQQPRDASKPFFVLFSDNEPYQLLERLNQQFPAHAKCGLIGASTPFVTGLPFTLFSDRAVLSSGVVGVALTNAGLGSTNVCHPLLEPVGPWMKILRCQGNVIVQLEGLHPSRLEKQLREQTMAYDDKETRLYAQVADQIGPPDESQTPMEAANVYRVTSGDPAKGTLSLDTVQVLQPGQWVRLCYTSLAKPTIAQATSSVLSITSRTSLVFGTTSPTMAPESSAMGASNQPTRCVGGRSDNGFIHGTRATDCLVPSSVCSVSLP